MSEAGKLLSALERLHEASPAQAAYAPWPDDLSPQAVMPNPVAASQTLGVRSLCGYFGYWEPDAAYDWHEQAAEELGFTLAGRAVFASKAAPNVAPKPGQARAHTANQPHMMMTLDQPNLAYALWRREGMEGLPRMTTP